MKHCYRKILTICISVIISITASAYDCEVDGILYDLSDNEATVATPDILAVDEANIPVSLSHYYSGDLVIPSSITYDGAVYNVTAIRATAFMFSTELTSVTIPSSVTKIEGGALFAGSSSLESIKVSSDNPVYDSRDNCNAIIETSSNTLIAGCKSTIIPKSVSSIGNGAFGYCYGLTSIIIPNSVKYIYSNAFSDCLNLSSITIGNGLAQIVSNSFSSCNSLESIKVANDNPVYDSRDNCNAIVNKETNQIVVGCKATTFPNSVIGISDNAFYGCTGLNSLKIDGGVKTIGRAAFAYCTELTSLTISSNVTSVQRIAFSYCPKLTQIVVADGNSKYDSRDNCNAIIEKASNTLVLGCKNTVIPSSVTSIGKDAFAGCSEMTTIDIPNQITMINSEAFYSCTNLKSVRLPEKLKTLGKHSFHSCTSLTSITIPQNVEEILYDAFAYCNNLCRVISKIEAPKDIDATAFFADTYSNATLYVPAGTIDLYKSKTGWKEFQNILDTEPSGINTVVQGVEETMRDYYSLDGKQLNKPQKGLNIIRIGNGKTKTIMVK